MEELGLIGERIWNMERDFNNRAGFTQQGRHAAEAPAHRAGEDRARPRGWSMAWTRCCPSTTSFAAGTTRDS